MSHTNVFSKTSDTKTIIRFVKEVERHPCLYDPKSPKYMDRELKRKTWIYIAKKANSTVADCKEKWTKIRTAYIRTLRPSYNDGIRTFSRPYYLASHLKFILPMKRNRACNNDNCPTTKDHNRQSEDTNENETNGDEGESDESERDEDIQDENSHHQVFLNEDNDSFDDDDDDDDDGGTKDCNNTSQQSAETVAEEISKRKNNNVVNRNESNCIRDEIMKPCRENVEFNPRKMFLFSLLPDIEDLDEQQMRYFRREVIKLIDKVMTD